MITFLGAKLGEQGIRIFSQGYLLVNWYRYGRICQIYKNKMYYSFTKIVYKIPL